MGKSGGVGLDLTADATLGIVGADFTVDPKAAEGGGGASNVTALCLLGLALDCCSSACLFQGASMSTSIGFVIHAPTRS